MAQLIRNRRILPCPPPLFGILTSVTQPPWTDCSLSVPDLGESVYLYCERKSIPGAFHTGVNLEMPIFVIIFSSYNNISPVFITNCHKVCRKDKKNATHGASLCFSLCPLIYSPSIFFSNLSPSFLPFFLFLHSFAASVLIPLVFSAETGTNN